MKIKLVVSGGQTGADLGGWFAAEKHKIKTAGWMPPGFENEMGSYKGYAKRFGARDLDAFNYILPGGRFDFEQALRDRTALNAALADLTLWFGKTNTAGYWCTRTATVKAGKRFIEVGGHYTPSSLGLLLDALGVESINVAGNRESHNPGIHQKTFEFLDAMFRYLKTT